MNRETEQLPPDRAATESELLAAGWVEADTQRQQQEADQRFNQGVVDYLRRVRL
jgi:hypothetical protein